MDWHLEQGALPYNPQLLWRPLE